MSENTLSWAVDRRMQEQRSVRQAWWVAGVACTIALLEGLALVGLAPMKTLVPYTVLVDRNTGLAQAVEGTGQTSFTPDEALTQAVLTQYVVAREGMEPARLPQDYRKAALWSQGDVRRDYLAQVKGADTVTPVEVWVEGVSLIAPGRAQVRYATLTRKGAGGLRQWWSADVTYRFGPPPAALADRADNPLGLAVTRYTRVQATPPAPWTGKDQP